MLAETKELVSCMLTECFESTHVANRQLYETFLGVGQTEHILEELLQRCLTESDAVKLDLSQCTSRDLGVYFLGHKAKRLFRSRIVHLLLNVVDCNRAIVSFLSLHRDYWL